MKKKNEKIPSARSISLAFKSFAMDASEAELDEALRSAGLDPESLVQRADSAFRSAVAASRKSSLRAANEKIESSDTGVILHKGLSTLIRLLRRKNGLSEQALAEGADVEVTEIHRIECDEKYSPGPRTIFQLEEYFKLPERTLAIVAGAMAHRSNEFKEEVLKFAAHSDELGKLSKDELKLVNSFVRYLAEEVKKNVGKK